jgi:hypothetical protein
MHAASQTIQGAGVKLQQPEKDYELTLISEDVVAGAGEVHVPTFLLAHESVDGESKWAVRRTLLALSAGTWQHLLLGGLS